METTKNRRSSILKPQKARNPLSDLDVVEAPEPDVALISGRHSLRRVSFASSNFIKEFVADPEKNTIWDTTYEEVITSDSTQSSENAHNTLGMQQTASVECVQVTTVDLTGSASIVVTERTQTVALTLNPIVPSSSPCNKENLEPGVPVLSLEKQAVQETLINVLNQPTEYFVEDNRGLQSGENSTVSMELTQLSNSSQSDSDYKNITNKDDMNMDFTRTGSRTFRNSDKILLTAPISGLLKAQGETNKTLLNNDDMEFTTTLSSGVVRDQMEVNRTKLGNNNVELTTVLPTFKMKSQTETNKTIFGDNMEFTTAFPTFKIESQVETNKTIVCDDNMEFTTVLSPSKMKSHLEANRTQFGNDAMELTTALSHFKMKSQIETNKTIVGDENMEFTTSLSPLQMKLQVGANRTKLEGDSMELTTGLPTFKMKPQAEMNKTILGDDNMEFTTALSPMQMKSQMEANRTKLGGDYMESTTGLPTFKIKPQVESNKTVLGDDNMEFTTAVSPMQMKLQMEAKRATLGTDNIEVMTSSSHVAGNRDSGMELTETLPVLSSVLPKRVLGPKIIINDENMDITKPACVLLKQNVLETDLKENIMNSDGINREDVELTNMEFTQFVPSSLMNRQSLSPVEGIVTSDLSVAINKSEVNTRCVQINQAVNIISPECKQRTIAQTQMNIVSSKTNADTECQQKTIDCPNDNKLENSCKSSINLNVVHNVGTEIVTRDESTTAQLKEGIKLEHINESNTQSTTGFPSNRLKIKTNESRMHSAPHKTDSTDVGMDYVQSTKPAVKNSESSLEPKPHVKTSGSSMEFTQGLYAANIETNKADNHINTDTDSAHIKPDMFHESMEVQESNDPHHPANSTTLKTPTTSFHMDLPAFSPFVDDTQHLINYSLSCKPPKSDFSRIIAGELTPPVNSKIMALSNFGSDIFPVSLETTRCNQTHCSENAKEELEPARESTEMQNEKPQQTTYIVHDETPVPQNCKESKPQQIINMTENEHDCIKSLKRHSLENIEDTVATKKMMMDDYRQVQLLEQSLKANMPNLSEESIVLSESIMSVDDSCNLINASAQKVVYSIKESMYIESADYTQNERSLKCTALSEEYNSKSSIKNKLEAFRAGILKCATSLSETNSEHKKMCEVEVETVWRPFKELRLREVEDYAGSSTDCSLSETLQTLTGESMPPAVGDDSTGEIETFLSIKEKVEKKCKRSKGYWTIHSASDTKYEFYTFYKAIRVEVEVNKDTGMVTKTDIHSHMLDDSEPSALFVHNIFKDRLAAKNIQSAVGEKYDVLTLVEYLYMNMQKALEILNDFHEFSKTLLLNMDQDFRVTFNIITMELRSSWWITVDLSDLNNITEDSITACAKYGSVKEGEIKSFVNNCVRGTSFLKSFVKNILGYRELLKKRKASMKSKDG